MAEKAPVFLGFVIAGLLFASPVRPGELETVRFGVCLSLSGDFAASGSIYLAGIRIRLDEFNREADRHGYRLEMALRDDASDPEAAAAIVRELAAEGVMGIIGSNSSSVTLAMLEPAREAGVAVITPSATDPAIGLPGSGSFRILFDDAFQGEALARFMRRSLGARRAAALANSRFSYSRSILDAFARVFEENGGEIVATETYERMLNRNDSFDFVPLLERLKLSRPQVVLLPGYAEDVAEIVRQSLVVDMRVIFCGGDTWEQESLLYESGNNVANSYYIGYLDENSRSREMVEFMRLLDSSNDFSAQPSSALGYDSLSLLIAGLAGGRDRRSVIDGLAAVRDFPLVTGPLTVDPERGIRKPAYVVKISDVDGRFRREVVDVVYP